MSPLVFLKDEEAFPLFFVPRGLERPPVLQTAWKVGMIAEVLKVLTFFASKENGPSCVELENSCELLCSRHKKGGRQGLEVKHILLRGHWLCSAALFAFVSLPFPTLRILSSLFEASFPLPFPLIQRYHPYFSFISDTDTAWTELKSNHQRSSKSDLKVFSLFESETQAENVMNPTGNELRNQQKQV